MNSKMGSSQRDKRNHGLRSSIQATDQKVNFWSNLPLFFSLKCLVLQRCWPSLRDEAWNEEFINTTGMAQHHGCPSVRQKWARMLPQSFIDHGVLEQRLRHTRGPRQAILILQYDASTAYWTCNTLHDHAVKGILRWYSFVLGSRAKHVRSLDGCSP